MKNKTTNERMIPIKIDAKKLNEICVYGVKPLAFDERFYSVPNATDYALSTYGRLFVKSDYEHFYRKVPRKLDSKGDEYYQIKFNHKEEKENVPIKKLMVMVFFPEEKGFLYPYQNQIFRWKKWRIEDCHLIKSNEQYIEVLKSIIEHREPEYSADLKNHTFINRWTSPKKQHINNKLNRTYADMKSRATNQKVKKRHKQYAETTICKQWLKNPAAFKKYWLYNQYFYPGKTSFDKDILGFGKTNEYAPGLAIEVPTYINDIFTKSSSKLGYCISKNRKIDGTYSYQIPSNAFIFDGKEKNLVFDTYIEALQAGRKRKAEYIRKVAKKERENGYIPKHILDTMEKWANLCELGLIKIWEPSEEILKVEGVL